MKIQRSRKEWDSWATEQIDEYLNRTVYKVNVLGKRSERTRKKISYLQKIRGERLRVEQLLTGFERQVIQW